MLSLSEIRVVELTTDTAGPYAGMIFADFGAEVIKVEDPEANPDRDLPRFRAAKFVAYNRNKKSIAIDLKSEEGRKLMLKLLEGSDLFLENLDPGFVDDLGFSYEVVSKLNPKIIYISIRGYLPGPYGDWPVVDPCIESLSGLTSTTGEPEPQIPGVVGLTEGRIPLTGHPPLVLAEPSIPCSAALHAAINAVGALMNRRKTGRGEKITVGMLEAGVSLVQQHISGFALYGTLGKHVLELRKTKDGWALIRNVTAPTARGTTAWNQFCKTFDVSEEIRQEYEKGEARELNAEKLEKMVDDILSKMSSREIRERLGKFGMEGAALGEIGELVNDEHLKTIRNFVPLTPDPEVTLTPDSKTAMFPLLPIRAGDYNPDTTDKWTPPPRLGEHTVKILTELGYTDEGIMDLRRRRRIV